METDLKRDVKKWKTTSKKRKTYKKNGRQPQKKGKRPQNKNGRRPKKTKRKTNQSTKLAVTPLKIHLVLFWLLVLQTNRKRPTSIFFIVL